MGAPKVMGDDNKLLRHIDYNLYYKLCSICSRQKCAKALAQQPAYALY